VLLAILWAIVSLYRGLRGYPRLPWSEMRHMRVADMFRREAVEREAVRQAASAIAEKQRSSSIWVAAIVTLLALAVFLAIRLR
jgi:hypothetical protein